MNIILNKEQLSMISGGMYKAGTEPLIRSKDHRYKDNSNRNKVAVFGSVNYMANLNFKNIEGRYTCICNNGKIFDLQISAQNDQAAMSLCTQRCSYHGVKEIVHESIV